MTPDEYKHGPTNGRTHFWLQFICGALLGVILDIGLCRTFAHSFLSGLGIFVACVASLGLAAGFLGDKFWYILLRLFRNW